MCSHWALLVQPTAKIVCICWRRILSFLFSFHSFLYFSVFCFYPIYIRTWESRDYFQIYNGYLLICVVLSARGLTCTLWMGNTAYRRRSLKFSTIHTRVLKSRSVENSRLILRKQKRKRNRRKQILRWCPIRTNDCALLFGLHSHDGSSRLVLHNSQWKWFFGIFSARFDAVKILLFTGLHLFCSFIASWRLCQYAHID